jgi:hypothetical protein
MFEHVRRLGVRVQAQGRNSLGYGFERDMTERADDFLPIPPARRFLTVPGDRKERRHGCGFVFKSGKRKHERCNEGGRDALRPPHRGDRGRGVIPFRPGFRHNQRSVVLEHLPAGGRLGTTLVRSIYGTSTKRIMYDKTHCYL